MRLLLCLALLLASVATLFADTRALPDGQLPDDVRLQAPKDLNGYFPLAVPKGEAEWKIRAERVKRQILVSQGLWPLPTKTPLNAVVHGKVERDGYTVERVYFEAMPGFYVTGSLYRPTGKSGKLPGVLRPHGHWANGRFHDKGLEQVRKDIAVGDEKFEEGGRSPLQALNVQLVRMGCVVFHYDMIGYADSVQLSFELAHRFKQQRPEMNTTENWGLFSAQAEANLQSIMGLQTWSSIRALDFITSLEDVDASRIGVTGASGGGTQTFILGAIDPRPTVIFPAVMVSTAMQGGCTCENASCLRVNTGNIEIAGLFAPKPLGMTGANDWTKEMSEKGFPELKQLYELFNAKDNVRFQPYNQFGHNYNYPSRAVAHEWFNKQLKLGQTEPIVERDYKRLSTEEMTVWDEKHPKPEGGPEFEKKLVKWWTDDANKQIDGLTPTDEKSLSKFREVVGGAVDVMIGRGLPAAADIHYEATRKVDEGKWLTIFGRVKNLKHHEELSMAFLYPKEWNGQAVIWLDDAGKAGLFDEAGKPLAAIQKLVDAGTAVIGVDLFMQGEFLADGKSPERNREVEGNRETAMFTYGYNHPVFAQRVQDVLTTISFVANHDLKPKQICLVALDPQVGPIAIAARAQARDLVTHAAVDSHGFRFGKLTDYRDLMFLPGGAKYGDLPGMIALAAPSSLWLRGEMRELPIATAAYRVAGGKENLVVQTAAPEDSEVRASGWILEHQVK